MRFDDGLKFSTEIDVNNFRKDKYKQVWIADRFGDCKDSKTFSMELTKPLLEYDCEYIFDEF